MTATIDASPRQTIKRRASDRAIRIQPHTGINLFFAAVAALVVCVAYYYVGWTDIYIAFALVYFGQFLATFVALQSWESGNMAYCALLEQRQIPSQETVQAYAVVAREAVAELEQERSTPSFVYVRREAGGDGGNRVSPVNWPPRLTRGDLLNRFAVELLINNANVSHRQLSPVTTNRDYIKELQATLQKHGMVTTDQKGVMRLNDAGIALMKRYLPSEQRAAFDNVIDNQLIIGPHESESAISAD